MSKKMRIMTLGQLARGPATIPTGVAWLLADLAEARGNPLRNSRCCARTR